MLVPSPSSIVQVEIILKQKGVSVIVQKVSPMEKR